MASDRRAGTRPRRPATRAAVAILVALSSWIPGAAAGQVIAGRVVDAATGAGVPRARVAAVGVGHDYARRAVSAADGRFSIALRRGGSFRMQVARTGYAETRTGPLTVGPGDTVAVDVRLAAAAHRLDPLTVTARPRRPRVTGAFRAETTPDSSGTRPVRVEGRSRKIGVRGAMPTPTFCYQLAGVAERSGQVVTLTVEARATGEVCVEATGAFTYDVTVHRLPPGSYALRVVHAYRGDVWAPTMALDTVVTVR